MASVGNSIQFNDADTVLNMYKNRGLAPWSIFQRSQMMFKFDGTDLTEGAAQLDKHLDALEDGGACLYTLKVYEDLPKGSKIKSNTPDAGGFNFALNEIQRDASGKRIAGVGTNRALESKLDALAMRVEQLAGEGDEGTEDRLGWIREILELPGVGDALPVLVKKLFGDKTAAVVSGVSRVIMDPGAAGEPGQDPVNDTIDTALDDLGEVVPDFHLILQKLAEVGKRDPAKLRNLVSMVNLL